jgi:Fe-Mn family superoxide dismutase
MEIHHDKHHGGYTKKLNAAIEGTPEEKKSIDDILAELDPTNKAVRNNGGGFYNHKLFWEVMSPDGGGKPSGEVAEAIDRDFGSYDEFKDQFSKAAAGRFGSGWAWLTVHNGGNLEISSTPNQDNPLMPFVSSAGEPILALDVWEHAYYLKYQNKRPDYIAAFFNVINWGKVNELYKANK